MKDSNSQEKLSIYKNLIISFANNAVAQAEGVAKQNNFGQTRNNSDSNNVQIYFYNDEVTVDIFLAVVFGYSVPKVVCEVQENLIQSIKSSTPLKVKNINVNITNVIFM
ncbi:MAG: Asp23/Gls24 family envelope stress response protein [Clostridia bacterium]